MLIYSKYRPGYFNTLKHCLPESATVVFTKLAERDQNAAYEQEEP